MVFFDAEEHVIKPERVRSTNIPKLGTQWKVIFDLKPVFVGDRLLLSLCDSEIDCASLMFDMSSSAIWASNCQEDIVALQEADAVPKLGQWTKVEMTHEKVDGEFHLALSLDGEEVARVGAHPGLQRLTDVSITLVACGPEDQGSIRRLVVLGN